MSFSQREESPRVPAAVKPFAADADFSRIRAVIFDMDGTLLDSERLSFKAWGEAAREYGVVVSRSAFLKMVGHRTVDCLRILQMECGCELPKERFVAQVRERYARLVRAGVPLTAGAREILEFCRSRAWKIGLATSTRRASAQEKLEQAGLWAFFDVATCGDEISAGKPAPEIYRATAGKLGVPATECLAVEDSPTGFRAAFSAGCVSVLVPDLVAPTDEDRSRAAGVFPSLTELRERLAAQLSRTA